MESEVGEFLDLERGYSDAQTLFELAEEAKDEDSYKEASGLVATLAVKFEDAEFHKMLSGEADRLNAIVTINAGAGGTESQDWAQMLLRMYQRWGQDKGFKVELMDALTGEEAGIKNATITISGPFAYGLLKSEAGVHRLVRISPFDSNARRHTSFTSVFVTPEIDDDFEVVINLADQHDRFCRAHHPQSVGHCRGLSAGTLPDQKQGSGDEGSALPPLRAAHGRGAQKTGGRRRRQKGHRLG
jgi:peptide chain release factor 2